MTALMFPAPAIPPAPFSLVLRAANGENYRGGCAVLRGGGEPYVDCQSGEAQSTNAVRAVMRLSHDSRGSTERRLHIYSVILGPQHTYHRVLSIMRRSFA